MGVEQRTSEERCNCAAPEPALMDQGLGSLCEKCYRPIVPDLTDAKLTEAQRKTLWDMQQGREFKSGPHLAALAAQGLIDRTGPNGRYEATQAGIRLIMEEREVICADGRPADGEYGCMGRGGELRTSKEQCTWTRTAVGLSTWSPACNPGRFWTMGNPTRREHEFGWGFKFCPHCGKALVTHE